MNLLEHWTQDICHLMAISPPPFFLPTLDSFLYNLREFLVIKSLSRFIIQKSYQESIWATVLHPQM